MITLKNTKDYTIVINYNETEVGIPGFSELKVHENHLGKLPKGIEKIDEEKILTEIDPYTDGTVQETPIDTKQLLNEGA